MCFNRLSRRCNDQCECPVLLFQTGTMTQPTSRPGYRSEPESNIRNTPIKIWVPTRDANFIFISWTLISTNWYLRHLESLNVVIIVGRASCVHVKSKRGWNTISAPTECIHILAAWQSSQWKWKIDAKIVISMKRESYRHIQNILQPSSFTYYVDLDGLFPLQENTTSWFVKTIWMLDHSVRLRTPTHIRGLGSGRCKNDSTVFNIHLNIKYLVFVLYSVEYWSNLHGFTSHCI